MLFFLGSFVSNSFLCYVRFVVSCHVLLCRFTIIVLFYAVLVSVDFVKMVKKQIYCSFSLYNIIVCRGAIVDVELVILCFVECH